MASEVSSQGEQNLLPSLSQFMEFFFILENNAYALFFASRCYCPQVITNLWHKFNQQYIYWLLTTFKPFF